MPHRLRVFAVSVLLGLGACDEGSGGSVQAQPPRQVSEADTYVFFLAGRGQDLSEAEVLAGKGFQVIAAPLASDADLDFAAVAVKERIRELMARGAAMDRIALVGKGEGGVLAMMVSGLAQVPASSLVVAGACPAQGTDGGEVYARMLSMHARTIKGRFLSLVDPARPGTGSCAAVQNAANGSEA